MTSLLCLALAFADDLPPENFGTGIAPVPSVALRDNGALLFWGQVQTWATLSDQDVNVQADPATYGDPEHDPGFTLQRARLGFAGVLPSDLAADFLAVDYGISAGINAPYDVTVQATDDLQIVDAFGRATAIYGAHSTSLAMGLHRPPVTRTSMMSSNTLVFQERSVSTAHLSPGREAGAVLGQALRLGEGDDAPLVLIRGGLFNGNGDIYTDTDPELMVTLRGEFSLGDTYQTFSDDLENAVGGGVGYLNNPQLVLSRNLISADLIARFKWITILGEVVQGTLTPGDSTVVVPGIFEETSQSGAMGQLSVYVPVAEAGGVEASARFSTYDDNTAVEDIGQVQILHAGATWRNPVDGLDVGAAFIHRNELDAFDNDTIRLFVQVRPSVRVF